MTVDMTARGLQLLGAVRRNFELLREHDKVRPDEVDAIVAAMIAHLRGWKPLAVLEEGRV